ncbi:MAG: hypothetical protein LDLANPLL_01244 [Turneriella sp.]|nr:hypothetical protein [Turneriella sp.]
MKIALASRFVLKAHERNAFIISVALHVFIFLILLLLASFKKTDTLMVRVILEDLSVPEKLETPLIEENMEELPRVKKKRLSKKMRASKMANPQNSTARPNRSTTLENPWGAYEKQMFRRQDSTKLSSNTRSPQTTWGSERTGHTEKKGTDEKIKVPAGSTASNTQWRKGDARRLISLPTIDYPESIRKKSGQGRVELLVVVNAEGRVESVEVTKSSGYSKLDINAKNAYRKAVFSASPSGKSATGIVVVNFRIKDNS